MPLDPRSPLHRFRVDPRVVQRGAIERLQALGVACVEISPDRSRSLLARFVGEFIDPARVDGLEAELARLHVAPHTLDFDPWLRPDCVHRGGVIGCVRWLLAGARVGRLSSRFDCVRFERAAGMPALALDLTTMDEAWAASWPGVFVSFAAGRAVVVTLDYEQVRCDVRAARGTPYR
jgi:hypothetical protein